MKSKPTVEYQWEAFDPDTGQVVKRGVVRTDRQRVLETAAEIQSDITGIDDVNRKRHLAPYWVGLKVRIRTRTIEAWSHPSYLQADLLQASETKV